MNVIGLSRDKHIANAVRRAVELSGFSCAGLHVCIVSLRGVKNDVCEELVNVLREQKPASIVLSRRALALVNCTITVGTLATEVTNNSMMLFDLSDYENLIVFCPAQSQVTKLRRGLCAMYEPSRIKKEQEVEVEDKNEKNAKNKKNRSSSLSFCLASVNVPEVSTLQFILAEQKAPWGKQQQSPHFCTVKSHRNPLEWKKDPAGYFLIKVEDGLIKAGFSTSAHVLLKEIIGTEPQDIYYTILREKLITSMQHAAYLGLELQKAHAALKLGLKYVQDSPLTY